MMDRYRAMNEQEKQAVQVYAVQTGQNVQYSSCWSSNETRYRLDSSNSYGAWTAGQHQQKAGSWIQVCTSNPKTWVALIIQGRADCDQWVKQIKISWTRNGNTWKYIENGKMFQACENRHQKVRIDFQELIQARVIRIHPQTFHNHVSLRFDAIYLDL